MSQNYKTYIWACEFNNSSGEGKLSYLYFKKLLKEKKINKYLIETPDKIYVKNNLSEINNFKKKKSNFYSKYITPFIGLFKIIFYHYVLKKKTVYLNYLPIWNIVLFIFLPKKTILGPITGSDFFIKISYKNFFRFLFLKIFNFFSKKIINLKYSNLIFSSNLINYKKKFYKNLFQLQYSFHKKKRKKVKKDIYLIFYYRKHPNKYLIYEKIFLKKLLSLNKKIFIVGDIIPEMRDSCLGFLSQKKLVKLLDRSKYTISSLENPFSFFVQDAILSNVNIIFHKQHQKFISKHYNNYSLMDFSKKKLNFIKIKNRKTYIKSFY